MGREARRVPKNWKHPKNYVSDLKPLHDNFTKRLRDWNEGYKKWQQGLYHSYAKDKPEWEPISDKYKDMSYEEYNSERPQQEDYMPDWSDEERTHYQMYETTSEGTPISPVFATPEELATWLVDNNANAFAHQTASYEAWFRVCKGGWAPSAVLSAEKKCLVSGVEGITEKK